MHVQKGRIMTRPNAAEIEFCTHFNLKKAMRTVSQTYDDALKPSGLRATQFTLLSALAAKGPLPLTKLAETMVVDRTTLTRNLRPLERDGYLTSSMAPDQRVRELKITAKGKRALEKALPLWRGVQKQFVKKLGQEEWSNLIGALSATVEMSLNE